MKDVKVYDGSGWQSLKGPPGPSEPSADAGNIIQKGSDGLLRVTGETQYGGEWTPTFSPTQGTEAEGYWVRCGRLVTLYLFCDSVNDNLMNGDILGGLPFAQSGGIGPSSLYYAGWSGLITGQQGLGVVGSIAIDFSGNGDEFKVFLSSSTNGGGFNCTIAYLTDDPPLR